MSSKMGRISCGNGIWFPSLLEFFLASDPPRIGKVAVKYEKYVFHLGIDRVMKTFDRIGARRDMAKSVIQMGKRLKIEGDMPLREMRRAKAELAAGDAIAGDETATFQML